MYNDKSKKSEVMNEQLRSLNEQTPAGKNSISSKKPSVFQSANYMDGYFSGSCNGGMLRPVTYKKVMAGEKIYDYSLKMRISMLTPKTPAYQKLKMTLKCFFVPDSRVWDNSERFYSQKGGSTVQKISEIPNLGGKSLFSIPTKSDNTERRIFTDTDFFRDSWVSTYVPKYQTGSAPVSSDSFAVFPKYSVIPLRGFKAIYNDFLRNKEYDSPLFEYHGDTVSDLEFSSFFPNPAGEPTNVFNAFKTLFLRGRRQNSYYTDYRTELLGDDVNAPSDALTNAVSLSEWQKQVAELRSEAENAQLNDWDIISKIRGSKPLEENKVILLGEREIGLNYHSVPQDTYNLNTDVQPEFQVLGQLGSYSYTEASVNLFQFQEFKQEGFLHVIAQVSADSVFESGFERTLLNVTPFDNYRPDLVDLKHDVLYNIEKSGTRISNMEELTAVTGFKRKYSEYFKLPNICQGDMTTGGYYKLDFGSGDPTQIPGSFLLAVGNGTTPIRFTSKRSYQFFEIDDKETETFFPVHIWQDYTDLLINSNQAIMQDVVNYFNAAKSDYFTYVQGQNQIFFLGIHSCVSDLPMDDKIKNNYTKWGEI